MVASQPAGGGGHRAGALPAEDEVPTRRSRALEHVGIAISHDDGVGKRSGCGDVRAHRGIPVPGCVDSLLHERYRFSSPFYEGKDS